MLRIKRLTLNIIFGEILKRNGMNSTFEKATKRPVLKRKKSTINYGDYKTIKPRMSWNNKH